MNRQIKMTLGWAVLLIISAVPVLLWAYLGPGWGEFNGYSSTTHAIGELAGLVGMTLFALTFVLSTRIKWIEDVFGGLDKVYIVHGILGGSALILILFHPIFLVLKFIPNSVNLAAKYLLPSSYWSVNFGIIALVGLIFLIAITLYSRLRYNLWKFTHEFLGLMFIFAVLHIFLVRGNISQDNIFNYYYWYAGIVSAIGVSAFSYSLFLKDRLIKNAVYSVSALRQKGDVFEIEMSADHKPISYKSGQFVFLRFYNEKLSKEAHPFSIASKSNSEKIKVVVKKLGDYTSRLEHLRVGDKVSIEGPYGRFDFREFKDKNQIWIAAGVGITPFIGMVDDFVDGNFENKVDLYYTAKSKDDFIDYEKHMAAEQKKNKFKFIPWASSTKGRLDVGHIEKISGDLKDKEFFICGPEGFKDSIMNGLIKKGIRKSRIHEEAFDFR